MGETSCDAVMSNFIKMPKIELHAHLSGSLSSRTIDLIVANHPEKEPIVSKYEMENPASMRKVFDIFPLIHQLLDTADILKLAIRETIREYEEENCIYLELRSGPKQTAHLTYEGYLRACIDGILEAREQFKKIKVFFIVSLDRKLSFRNAEMIMSIVGKLKLESDVMVGLELSGSPDIDGRHLIPLFEHARNNLGLGITIHLAELRSHLDEVSDFLKLHPDRIGHGTFLHTDPHFVEMMKKLQIPLEICLTSNVYTGSVSSYSDSHLEFWKELVPISINTDDKGIFPGATLSEEYYKAYKYFNLTAQQFSEINMNALKASFAWKNNVTDLSDIMEKIHNFEMHF